MHVLKIHRSVAAGLASFRANNEVRTRFAESTHPEMDVIGFSVVDSMLVPGLRISSDVEAVIELAPDFYLHAEPDDSPTFSRRAKAENLLTSGNNKEAAELLLEILEINPYHSIALYYLSQITSGTSTGADLARQCFDVEPNLLPYAVNCGLRCSEVDRHHDVLTVHGVVSRKFPYNQTLKPAAIQAALSLERVEEAYDIRMSASSKRPLAKFDAEIEKQMNGRLRASLLMDEAREACLAEAPNLDLVLNLLRRAHDCPGKEVLVQLNLALVLAQAGEAEQADELLDMLLDAPMHRDLAMLCAANLGYLRLRRGLLSEGQQFLLQVMQMVEPGSIYDSADLFPRPCLWVNDRIQAYPHSQESALAILEAAIESADEAEDTQILESLAEMYRDRRQDLAKEEERFKQTQQDFGSSSDTDELWRNILAIQEDKESD